MRGAPSGVATSPKKPQRLLTFLPAYLPRVIMATRPTLRNFILGSRASVVSIREELGGCCREGFCAVVVFLNPGPAGDFLLLTKSALWAGEISSEGPRVRCYST